MSRIEFSGFGDEIPLEALPGAVEGDLRPLTYNLPDGSIFRAADYLAFGYTHYEVICIGGEGGRGGDINDLQGATTMGSSSSHGGAGGGGGLHRVAGRLDELDAEVIVEVGSAGANGSTGNGQVRYLPTTGPTGIVVPYDSTPDPPNLVLPGITYVLHPNPAYVAPTDGQNGGASEFGDVAQASGGKGGKKTPYYRDVQWASSGHTTGPGGAGGEGGIGGSVVAGGGGAGGYAGPEPVDPPGPVPAPAWPLYPPVEGDWDGDIGEGGGGGMGGMVLIDNYMVLYSG